MTRKPGVFTRPGHFSRGTLVARIKPAKVDVVADAAMAKLGRAMTDLERATEAWLESASDDEIAEVMEMRHRCGFDRVRPAK
jgi:hypothetical protein